MPRSNNVKLHYITERIGGRVALTLTLGTAATYVLVFVAMDGVLENQAGILATVPVVVAAWLYGWRGGLVAGLLAFPLNSLLVILTSDANWGLWLRQGGVLGTGALVVVGATVGELRSSSDRLKRETIERKRAEEELKEYSSRLQEMVEERTSELKESQTALIRAGKMEAIGQLAAGVANELNNPLGAVVGYSDILLEQCSLDDISKDYVNRILKRGEQAAKVVRQLSGFAQPSDLQKGKVDLSQVIENTIELVAHQMSLQGIRVATHLDPQTRSVWADRDCLEQVFLNLALNAKDSMPEGGELTITMRLDEGGRSVGVTIADTGMGIPEGNLGKIFDPFFTWGKNGQGTGLGLSISQRIVEDHSGQIKVESEERRGTTFSVLLPRSE